MIVVCPACQARYRFDEAKLGDRPKVKTRCAKCGGSIEIENPLVGGVTMPPSDFSSGAPAWTGDAADTPTPAAPFPPPTATAAPRAGETLTTRETPVQPREAGSQTLVGGEAARLGILQLPKDRRFSLAVIQGAATGQIFPITKTRTVIGRSGSDVNIDDPEASRQHAAIEIVGEVAVLRDLGSTNGTWIDLDRVEQHQISNQQEFRIGSHVLMFIVTEVE
jgi:predicted Zn finger-like uncharacterized protein